VVLWKSRQASDPMNSSQKYKLVAACMIGNLLEWYDFAIYGYL
jgi:hypothetical protein